MIDTYNGEKILTSGDRRKLFECRFTSQCYEDLVYLPAN